MYELLQAAWTAAVASEQPQSLSTPSAATQQRTCELLPLHLQAVALWLTQLPGLTDSSSSTTAAAAVTTAAPQVLLLLIVTRCLLLLLGLLSRCCLAAATTSSSSGCKAPTHQPPCCCLVSGGLLCRQVVCQLCIADVAQLLLRLLVRLHRQLGVGLCFVNGKQGRV